MSEQFTKGPWSVDEYGNIVPVNGRDARDCIRAGGLALTSNSGEPMYNRHLIACAPDMYEMLKALLPQIAGSPAALKINRLLAKARGEQ